MHETHGLVRHLLVPMLISLAAGACAETQDVGLATLPQDSGTVAADGPAFADVPDATDADESADITRVKSTIRKVTVYSDRARVTREAEVHATTEPTVFAFARLPGWVDDGSVRVSVSAGRIVDVRVQRTFLAHATDEATKKAQEHHQALTNQLAGLDDELQVLAAQKAQIESIKVFSVEKISKDASFGDINVGSYGSVVKFISDSLRATAEARRTVQVERDRLVPEVEASKRALAEVVSLMALEETTVAVTLVSSQPTSSVIGLTYMMPGATWEPMHELRASTQDGKKVEVTSYAVVTQTSGEDWGGAELAFSTQSSTEAVRIPELEALTLGETHTASRVMTSRVSSYSRAEKAFKGQSQLWNKVANDNKSAQNNSMASQNFEEVFQSNMNLLEVVQSRTVQIFQKLQRRGTTAHFRATVVKSVRGDGHPVRLRIGRTSLDSLQKIVAVPEQSLNAARTLEMTNSSGQPLLPGKVALYQDGAFLGMTEIDFIAEGEPFALFLSVADHIKLARKLDRKKSSLVRKRRNRMQVSFIVTVENLSDRTTSLTLADRIPVSENREIRVDGVKITPNTKPNSKGLIQWALELSPKEVRTFRISYRVEYPPTLVLQTAPNTAPTNQANEPFAPSQQRRMRKSKIEDQLQDLETLF